MLASGMLVFRAGLCTVGYEFWLQLLQVPYYARLASEAGITLRGCQWQLRVPNRTGRESAFEGIWCLLEASTGTGGVGRPFRRGSSTN